MKTIIFFSQSVKGHYMEYLHHEATLAAQDPINKYYLLVPPDFEKRKSMLKWPTAQNIEVIYLTETEAKACADPGVLKGSWAISKTLRKYSKQLHADYVFLNTLINSMPFLPFFLPKRTKATGIIYGIYLWQKEEISSVKWLSYEAIYWLFAWSDKISGVFLLNDNHSATILNKKLSTDKFFHLPDPIPDIDPNALKDIRADLGIRNNDLVYLQFSLEKRKHTLDILDGIAELSPQELENRVFIFTGSLKPDIEKEFYQKVNALRGKCKLIVDTGLIPYERLFKYCKIANYMFILYDNAHMSSGALGYAAYFNSSVIGTSKGLVGNLIKTNDLGMTIDEISPQQIKNAILNLNIISGSKYADSHTTSSFIKAIKDIFII